MSQKSPLQAISVARVSTKEQKSGNSLPGQVDRINRYFEQNPHLKLGREFIYDESGHGKSPGEHFKEVLNHIGSQDGKIALVCDKVDRLIRSFVVSIHKIDPFVQEGKLELHFVSDNLVLTKDSSAPEKFYFNMAIVLAQYFSDAIGDNVKRGYERILNDGRWIGKAPIGYISQYDEVGRRNNIVIDPLRAHFVRSAFSLYSSGDFSVQRVQQILHQRGFRDEYDRPVRYARFDMMLKNPFYAGVMKTKNGEYPHQYETLVSHHVFTKCMMVRANNKKQKVQYRSRRFLFGSGFMKCGLCGAAITAEQKTKPSGKRYIYYSCTGSRGCKKIYVSESHLIEIVYHKLKRLEKPQKLVDELIKALRAVHDGKSAYHKRELHKFRIEYDRLSNRLQRLPDLLLDERISKEFYDRKVLEYSSRQQILESDMIFFRKVGTDFYVTIKNVYSAAIHAFESFKNSSNSEKRSMLDLLFQNPTLNGKEVNMPLKQHFETLASVKVEYPLDLQPYLESFRTFNWKNIEKEWKDADF